MYTKEKKILRFSMMLLFLALMIVYSIWYQIKGNELKKGLSTEKGSTGVQIVSIVPVTGNSQTKTIENSSGYNTGTTVLQTGITETITEGGSGTITTNDNITLLSGTNIYYGKIDIIEKLGIKYQYALIDSTGSWFIYLGAPSYDFASIARALNGSIYTMATEQELIENKLFGSKVVFINIPEYKDQQVIMLIYMKNGIWLVQIDYDLYHKSKTYLKSLFID